MKKVISNNLKNILAGSIIAGSLVGLQSCDETQNAEDLGNGDTVRETLGETEEAAVKKAEEIAKDVEGKCGEGKCGEGKCGEGKCGEAAIDSTATDSTAKTTEGKCGEGKCGEGKCGE